MAIVRNILVRVGADVNPMQKGLSQAQKSLSNFSARQNRSFANIKGSAKNMNGAFAGAMTGMKASLAMVGIAAVAVSAKIAEAAARIAAEGSQLAIKQEASLQQISRIFGNSSQDFMKWANTQGRALGLSKAKAAEYGAVYGNLVSNIYADQKEITKYTEQLLKSSAVVASGTGRDIQDVMERMRSGLLGNTESIEDLGINVNVAMLESTAAFKQFAGNKSWDQLDFRTQQQIRLFAILEQSTKKYGTEVNQNTASSLTKLNAVMENIKLNIGNAFLPLINRVVPILTYFAEILEMVTARIAAFMQALFGVNTEQTKTASTAAQAAAAQNKLGNATAKAGAKAKRGVAAFDEINQLQKEMASSAENAASGISNTGSNIPASQLNVKIPPELQALADKIKKNLAPSFEILGKAFDNLKKATQELWDVYKPFVKPFLDLMADTSMIAFKLTIDGIALGFQLMAQYMEGVKNILTSGLAKLFSLLGIEMYSAGESGDGLNGTLSLTQGLLESKLPSAFGTFAAKAAGKLAEFAGTAAGKWVQITEPMEKARKLAAETLVSAYETAKTVIPQKLAILAANVVTNIKKINDPIENLRKLTGISLPAAFETAKIEIPKKLANLAASILKSMPGIKEPLQKFYNWFYENFVKAKGNIFEKMYGAASSAFSSLGGFLGQRFGQVANDIKTSYNSVINVVNAFIETLNNLKIEIPKVNIPGTKIELGGGSIGFPHIDPIPHLARGGITSGPTLAVVGDNVGGREVISPLDDMREMIMDSMRDVIQEVNSQKRGNTGPTTVIMQVGQTEFGRVVINAINSAQRQAGVTLVEV